MSASRNWDKVRREQRMIHEETYTQRFGRLRSLGYNRKAARKILEAEDKTKTLAGFEPAS